MHTLLSHNFWSYFLGNTGSETRILLPSKKADFNSSSRETGVGTTSRNKSIQRLATNLAKINSFHGYHRKAVGRSSKQICHLVCRSSSIQCLYQNINYSAGGLVRSWSFWKIQKYLLLGKFCLCRKNSIWYFTHFVKFKLFKVGRFSWNKIFCHVGQEFSNKTLFVCLWSDLSIFGPVFNFL